MVVRSKFYEPAPRDPIFDSRFDPPKMKLTAEGVAFVRKNGFMPAENDARADSTVTGDGLEMIVHFDAADRKVKEFKNVGSRKVWLDRFKAAPLEQVQLNTKNIPMDQFPAVEAKWRERVAVRDQAARDMAAGRQVLFDIETGERLL